jgi:hypothetical protein
MIGWRGDNDFSTDCAQTSCGVAFALLKNFHTSLTGSVDAFSWIDGS